ncbi:MAG: MFS transporter [Acidipila sp.]|nr:MFS transporter [Acidipila sp.]
MTRKIGVSTKVLMVLCALSFIVYLDRVSLSAAAGSIKAEFGFSNTTLGLAFSAFGYSYAVFQIVGGWFSDRFGAKLTLIICGCVWVCATVSTAFVTGLVSLLAVRLLLGMGEGATLPAQSRAISNWYAKEKRGFVLGFTHAFSRLGNAITPPLIAFLIALYSWRASFVITGGLTAIWVVVWAWYFQDDPRKHKGVEPDELATLPAMDSGRDAQKRMAIPWRAILKRMRPTMIVYFCNAWTTILYFTWLPLFFMHGQHLNLMNSAFFSSGVFCAGVLGDVTGGVVSDQILRRTGNVVAARQNVIAVSLVGGLIFLVPLLFSHNLAMITACLAGASFFSELTIGPIWAVPMDIAPQFTGTASGMLNAASAVAGILSPTVFGLVVDKTGNWTLPFAGAIAFLVIGIIMSFRIRPDRRLADTMASPAMLPSS